MTNKTPFELRFDVLAMAKDYFDRIQQANNQLAREAFLKAVELNSNAIKNWSTYVPSNYTIDEMLEKANQFYDFVNNSKKN